MTHHRTRSPAAHLLPLLLSAAVLPAPARAHDSRPRPVIAVPPDLQKKTAVCTDNKGHLLAVTPDLPDQQIYTMVFYGDGKLLFEVPGYLHLTRTLFRDPRHYNTRASGPEGWSHNREDRRLLSGVSLEDGKCSIWCGVRDKAFTLVEPAKAQALLKGATFLPSPRKWLPHALARDDEGTYYLVDHGAYADTQKEHRLFIGRKGALKPVGITEVISDSGGDVILARTGTLALPKTGAPAWKVAGKATPLIRLTLEETGEEGPKNLMLIYNELGVYKGERLGTPCDDL